jgi:AraC-like DNA-binding protein
MKPYFQKIAPGPSSFTAFVRSDPAFPFDWHYHPEYELTLILESEGRRLVGDSTAEYGAGDLVLVGPNVPHTWRSIVGDSKPEEHRAVVIQFRRDFLGERFFELNEMESVASLLDRSSKGLAFGHTVTGGRVAEALKELPSLPPARRLALLLSLLVELAGEQEAKVLSTVHVKPTYRSADQQRVQAICLYLHEHFGEEIDFAQIASHFHMDQAWLCRFFKRATGRTMTAYLNELRVGAAAQLLIDTDQSVLEIGFQVGFGNYSNFNRQFKRIKGYGPRTLRDQFSPDPATRSRSLDGHRQSQ